MENQVKPDPMDFGAEDVDRLIATFGRRLPAEREDALISMLREDQKAIENQPKPERAIVQQDRDEADHSR